MSLLRVGALSSVRRAAMSSMASTTPIEDTIRQKVLDCLSCQKTELIEPQVTEALNPTMLEIRNDSHLHSHHKAMVGVTSKETHFAYVLQHFRLTRTHIL